jgi:hypothetical protein
MLLIEKGGRKVDVAFKLASRKNPFFHLYITSTHIDFSTN